MFKIELAIGNELTKSSGDTLLEALDNLKPVNMKAKSLLTVSRNKKKKQIVLYPLILRKLMTNHLSKVLLEKRLTPFL